MLNVSADSFLFYFLIAAIQGFILSSMIILYKPIQRTNVFLGILLFLFSLSLLHGVLETNIHAFNIKFPIPMNYGFMYGPLAYFLIKAIAEPALTFKRQSLWHFFPSLFFDVLIYISFFIYAGYHMEWVYSNIINIQTLFLCLSTLTWGHMLVYSIFIYAEMKEANKNNTLSQVVNRWFKIFKTFWILILIFLATTISVVMINLESLEHNYKLLYPLSVLASICIYWLGYSYHLKYRTGILKHIDQIRAIRYSREEINKYKHKLIKVLEEKKFYQNEKLNLKMLAQSLGWSTRELSAVISQAFCTNFNDLINTYRIETFKTMVLQPENQKYSIEGVAQMVGFNSKASFYRAFKKHCGQTPKEFMDNTVVE